MAMARPAEPGLLGRIVRAATLTFIRRGYRGSRIEQVAEEAGVSVGTIYRYVAGKDALFELSVKDAFGQLDEDRTDVPYGGSGRLDFVDELWRRLLATHPASRLREALEADEPEDPATELEEVVRDVYRWELRYWKAIRLIERCARDWPELDLIYYRQFRREMLGLGARYLGQRAKTGDLMPVPDPALAARVVGEAIAFFALHRHTAPDSEGMDEQLVEDTLATLLTNAFLPPSAEHVEWAEGRRETVG
jgi:AcrR family transcriptional regulator